MTSTTLDPNICSRKSFQVDVIVLSKHKFSSAILFFFGSRISHSYVGRQSHCFKYQITEVYDGDNGNDVDDDVIELMMMMIMITIKTNDASLLFINDFK